MTIASDAGRCRPIMYYSVHEKIRRRRGSASAHACRHCSRPAHHWAYDHTDPSPLRGVNREGRAVTYSPDVDRYMPLCRHCHAIFDGAPPPGCDCHNVDGSLAAS